MKEYSFGNDMVYEKEMDKVLEYIENFDTSEFSSSDDFIIEDIGSEQHLARAKRMRARLSRKHKMEMVFEKTLAKSDFGNSSVTITQDEIDDLLSSLG